MGNTQGVWSPCVIVLILNFLIADGQEIAVERHVIERATNKKKNQHKYFINALVLKRKSKIYLQNGT